MDTPYKTTAPKPPPELERDRAIEVMSSLFEQPVAPFCTFDLQDSGCISWGVEIDDARYLVKYADHEQLNGLGERAVTALQGAVTFHEAVTHPSMVPILWHRSLPEGLALVYPWVEGEVLSSPEWPNRRTNPRSPFSR